MKALAENRRPYWPLILGCTLFLVSPATSEAESDPEPEFYSLKDWAPIHTWEYYAIPAANAADLTIALAVHPPPRWRGGILFDQWAQRGLTLSTEAARTHADTVSTVLVVSLGLFPLVFDAGVLTWWIHKRSDLAWQMLVLDAEVLTFTGLVTTLTSHTVGRERPGGHREDDSFFSGHTSIAASAATLICLQHLDLDLLGSKALDGGACGLSVASAVATGFLRIMASRHYASDVIVGAAVGVSSAFLVYNLKVKPSRSEKTVIQLLPVMSSDFFGLSVSGSF